MKKGVFVLSKDLVITLIILYLVICEFLPIVNVISSRILSVGKMCASAFFLLAACKRNRKFALECIMIIGVTLLVNIWAFYHCWINYTPFAFFMKESMICWIYMIMGVYIMQYSSAKTRISIRNVILILVCVTAVTTIISLHRTPNAVRELGNGSSFSTEMNNLLYLRNTSTWSEIYGMVFLLPFIILLFKQTKKVILLFIIAILETCVLLSQVTIAIIISLCFLLFLFIKPLLFREMIIYGIILVPISILMMNYSAQILLWLYRMVLRTNMEMLKIRLYQLYMMFSAPKNAGNVTSRIGLYMESLETFFSNPIIGYKLRNISEIDGFYIGMHSQILDLLAAIGVVGMIPMVISLYVLMKNIINQIHNECIYRYFVLAIIMMMILMLINPTYYSGCIYMSVFWGPACICHINKNPQSA